MLKLSSPQFTEEAIEGVAAVLRSGMLVQGAWVRRFEQALAESLGVSEVVVVSSGTAALHLALLGAGLQAGDEVLVPAFTFPATANAVVLAGGRPVLVDIGLSDFCIDPAALGAAVTPRTRFILPVHEFGQAADLDAIMVCARARGLQVIEDAACAFGTEYDGRKVGTFGACGCFSFHPRKAITTGEGGAISTNDAALAGRLRALRNHGIHATSAGNDFVAAGLNYRMTEFQAVLGVHQMPGFEDGVARRIAQARRYDELLAGVPGLRTPASLPRRRAVYQTYHVVLPEAIERAEVIASLKARGIETNLGAQALNCLTYFQEAFGYDERSCPQATIAFRRGLALPMGGHCRDSDIASVADALRAGLAGV